MVDEPTLDDIKRALQLPRPGLRAQIQMAPQYRTIRDLLPAHQPKEGGVLILLYPKGGWLHIPLTRRTETVADHKGQISLPGGAHEASDGSLEWTALRETQEELGVDPRSLEVLGPLTPLYIPPSGYRIHPYVASRPERPAFRPDPVEVAELLEVPLVTLLDPATRREEDWELRGRTVRVPFFQVGEHKVWGATAMVLNELVTLLRELR
jgi:8-oxo-dGTP pyrophosphatase MutT (NUDIX family)